ncbi:MAG: hypothetical protein ABJM63_05515 [Anderseniella sp.]
MVLEFPISTAFAVPFQQSLKAQIDSSLVFVLMVAETDSQLFRASLPFSPAGEQSSAPQASAAWQVHLVAIV